MLALDSISKVYSLAGRHEEAISAASEAVRVKDEAKAPVNRALHVAAVSEAYASAARLDEAEVAAREALDWARQLGERPAEALAQRLLGEIAGRRGDHAAATRHLREGLAIATALGINPLAERCRAALAGLS
jgi:tetratricopeptide (TPR) repeat protein